MRNAILALVIFAASGTACAQWVMVTEGESGNKLYVDPNTIKKRGDLRRYWQLYDLAKADKNGNLSYRSVIETDCKEERMRVLEEDIFRGPMASGEISGSSWSPTEWRYIAPGTTGVVITKFVCSQ